MYIPATQRQIRDALKAGERARAEAISEFWTRLNPFSREF